MAALNAELTWAEILNFNCWTSLKDLCPGAREIGWGYYSVAPDAYVLTQAYDRMMVMGSPGSPFVTLAVWAPNDEIIRKMASMDFIEVEASEKNAPQCLFVNGDGTYKGIISSIPNNLRGISERAAYGPKGDFLYREVDAGRFRYMFSSIEANDSDVPFCIEVRLQSIK